MIYGSSVQAREKEGDRRERVFSSSAVQQSTQPSRTGSTDSDERRQRNERDKIKCHLNLDMPKPNQEKWLETNEGK